ncbi:MAG: succinylglutamate desuccinylase/aspartoacylase family protein [Alphaproteobacteria bacterium]|nr:succinylglutamate desuccinylase/aspartoacylase family protein [Alphaproteobacteria bacterium]
MIERAGGEGMFAIGGTLVPPGRRATVDLPISNLYDHTPVTMTVQVVNGVRPGPRLFVCAALHGDEINGVEVIRRLLRDPALDRIAGTLIAIPIVNIFGFLAGSRYLPDRRDLNRSFPGSPKGSLAGRLANVFVREILERATHGIDLHTAAVHRDNFPQIRANLDDEETLRLARAFGVDVVINAGERDGSLRQQAAARKVPVLVYEAGEALRFDEPSIGAGVAGVLGVMASLGMIGHTPAPARREPIIARSSTWLRAPTGGMLRTEIPLGTHVDTGQRLGIVGDPYGTKEHPVVARGPGLVIGRTRLPVVNAGDALFHLVDTHGTKASAVALDLGDVVAPDSPDSQDIEAFEAAEQSAMYD